MCDKNTWLSCKGCKKLKKDSHDHDKVVCDHKEEDMKMSFNKSDRPSNPRPSLTGRREEV